jgi:hypothetical protein
MKRFGARAAPQQRCSWRWTESGYGAPVGRRPDPGAWRYLISNTVVALWSGVVEDGAPVLHQVTAGCIATWRSTR